MTEKQLQECVRRLAIAKRARVYHTHDSRHSPPGFPDCVIVTSKPARLIFAELKSEKGRVSVAQQGWLDALSKIAREHYLIGVYLWRPIHWKTGEIERVLDGACDLLTSRWAR